MKKLLVMSLLLGCLVGCGTESSSTSEVEIQQSTVSSSVVEIIEPVMYEEYQDVQDFGKTYGVPENQEKTDVLKQTVSGSGIMLVYDVPEEHKEDIESWKQSLLENGFVIENTNTSDGGEVITYSKEETKEKVILAAAVSTEDSTMTVMTVAITDFSVDGILPTADDPNLAKIIEEQNRAQVHGDYLIQDGWIYGLTWNDSGNAIFAKKRLDGTDYTKMTDGYFTDIFLKDAYVYGAKLVGKKQGIYKMRSSGEDIECILEGNDMAIQVTDDYIYYTPDIYLKAEEVTDASTHLYRCDLDGNNIEEVIAKPVYCWYVFENAILYQDDRDNCSLHIYDLERQTDTKVNDQISYNPIYDGEYIYYSSDVDEKRNIWRVKPDGSDNIQISSVEISGDIVLYNNYIYFVNIDDSNRIYRMDKDGTNLTQISQDKNCDKLCFSGDNLIYTSYDKNFKYIDKNVMCDPDGSNAEKIQLR